MTPTRTLFVVALLAPLAALPFACTTDGSSNFGDDDDGSGTNTGSGGNGGSTATVDFTVGNGGSGGSESCLSEEAQATPITLDMIVVVDRSGSMVNQGYWQPTVNALKAFFDDPSSGGVNVGLNLFPNPSTGNDCAPTNWNPTFVPNDGTLAPLPADAQTLKTALDNNPSVSGQLTPMYGALDGSYQFALAHQMANPTNKVIVALAGDGNPEGGFCQTHYGNSSAETIAGCATLAGTYFNDHAIETYTISISSTVLAAMNQIAQEGGTVQAYDVSNNINAFTQKMQEIRDTALGCEYLIPEDSETEFDPLNLNVLYTPGGGAAETIPQADNAGDCGNEEGWYYDDPVDPTKVIFCPATCARVEGDPNANVQLSFGCPTVVN